MIRNIASLLLIGGAMSLSAPAMAQTAAVEGAGAMMCADLIKARDTQDQDRYSAAAHWVLGYLTAASGYSEDTFDLTPWQTPDIIMAQISQFCGQNPDKPLVQATVTYVNYLKPQRLTEPEQLVELRQGTAALTVYASVLTQVQEKLVALGRLEAVPEGFDQPTAEAIRTLQGEAKLPETGLPDGRTILHLFNM
ncbi:HdeA/HdeB family chaperone [Pseudooceanicola onchidii]|uniref:HdeA/HdeB family chaperone n=1 Tax=Pseudooceanicola onchidii TaxID=2562279 RepID=UPI00145AE8C6|nr:HdeA/HdeB family chaperone [Pseudooceanicola onchidii]